MKKTVVILLTLILMMTNLGTVLADTVSAPPANQISANPNYAEVELFFSKSTHNLSIASEQGEAPVITYVKSSISKKSTTSVSISAITETSSSVTRLGGYINVQRWINNKWSTYTTISFWNYNAARATKSTTVSVPSGYYYRLRVNHVAINTYGTKQVTSITTSVLVN